MNPIHPLWRGNLAPEGVVAKISGKEGLHFEGKAIVFEGEEKPLPNHPHRVGFELGVGGHDVPVLTVRLRDQQTVERVFVMQRQVFQRRACAS